MKKGEFMKISKRVTLWTLGVACVCALGMYPNLGYSQEGEAVDVDSLLMRKTTVPEAKQTLNEKKALSRPNKGASKDQKVIKDAERALEEAVAEAKAENEDDALLAKKIKLAKEMHKIRPTREQVNSAVRKASMSLSEYEQASFISAMESMLNYNAIERISVDAMVETYSHKELVSMVEYFSKPEAMSASKKILPWARKVQPEIAHMIDRAMMRIRTGQ